jgi:CheY-like chemotaxis protein
MASEKFNKRVLVVDDEILVLSMMAMLFKRKFEICHEASNGQEALQILEEHNDIDCVITDISMPVMDGYELRSHVSTMRPELPVIAVTGHSDETHIQRMREHRFSHIILKPVDRDKVADMVNKIVGLSA